MFNAFESLALNVRSGEPIRVEQSNFPVLLRLSQGFEIRESIRVRCLRVAQFGHFSSFVHEDLQSVLSENQQLPKFER